MKIQNTFVRVKGPQRFVRVVAAYERAGAIVRPPFFANPTYIRCTEDNILYSGNDEVMKEYTSGYTELVLRNGELVPAVEPVDWTQRYVRVTGQHEYDAAIAALVKLTGRPILNVENGSKTIAGFVGLGNLFGEVMSEGKSCNLRGSEAPLAGLLKAAGIELSKPKDRRTKITYAEYPDGSRSITKIENCLTREECQKVAPGYLEGTPHYYLDGEGRIQLEDALKFPPFGPVTGLKFDTPYRIGLMKKAGERFVACKKAAAEKAAAEKAAAEKAKPKIVEVLI